MAVEDERLLRFELLPEMMEQCSLAVRIGEETTGSAGGITRSHEVQAVYPYADPTNPTLGPLDAA